MGQPRISIYDLHQWTKRMEDRYGTTAFAEDGVKGTDRKNSKSLKRKRYFSEEPPLDKSLSTILWILEDLCC